MTDIFRDIAGEQAEADLFSMMKEEDAAGSGMSEAADKAQGEEDAQLRGKTLDYLSRFSSPLQQSDGDEWDQLAAAEIRRGLEAVGSPLDAMRQEPIRLEEARQMSEGIRIGAGEAERLAGISGIAADMVREDPDMARVASMVARFEDDQPVRQLVDERPWLVRALETDGDFFEASRTVRDLWLPAVEMAEGGRNGGLLDSVRRGYLRGMYQTREANIGAGAVLSILTGQADGARLDQIRQSIEAERKQSKAYVDEDESWISPGTAAEQLYRMATEDLPLQLAGALAAAGLAAAAGVTAPVAGVAALGAIGVGALQAMRTEMGAYFAQRVTEKDDAGQYLPPEEIAKAAVLYGVPAGLIEGISDKAFMNLYGSALKPIAASCGATISKAFGRQVFAAAAAEPALKTPLLHLAGALLQGAAFEGGEEFAQAITEQYVEKYSDKAMRDAGKIYRMEINARGMDFAEAFEQAKAGAGAGFWFGLIPGSVRTAYEMRRAESRSAMLIQAHDQSQTDRARELLGVDGYADYLRFQGMRGQVAASAQALAALDAMRGGSLSDQLGADRAQWERLAESGEAVSLDLAQVWAALDADNFRFMAPLLRLSEQEPGAQNGNSVRSSMENSAENESRDVFAEMADQSLFGEQRRENSPREVLHQLAADGTERGSVLFGELEDVITLFQNQDASTLPHEIGHLFFRHLQDASENSESAALDLDILMQWAGETQSEISEDSARPGIEDRTAERIADGFVTYLQEGRAPNPQLQGVFARFRRWLADLWQAAQSLIRPVNPPLNDSVRSVFAHWLAENGPGDSIADRALYGVPLAKLTPDEIQKHREGARLEIARLRDEMRAAGLSAEAADSAAVLLEAHAYAMRTIYNADGVGQLERLRIRRKGKSGGRFDDWFADDSLRRNDPDRFPGYFDYEAAAFDSEVLGDAEAEMLEEAEARAAELEAMEEAERAWREIFGSGMSAEDIEAEADAMDVRRQEELQRARWLVDVAEFYGDELTEEERAILERAEAAAGRQAYRRFPADFPPDMRTAAAWERAAQAAQLEQERRAYLAEEKGWTFHGRRLDDVIAGRAWEEASPNDPRPESLRRDMDKARDRRLTVRNLVRAEAERLINSLPFARAADAYVLQRMAQRALRLERQHLAEKRYGDALGQNVQSRIFFEAAAQASRIRERFERVRRTARRFVASQRVDPDARYIVRRLALGMNLIRPETGERLEANRNAATIREWYARHAETVEDLNGYPIELFDSGADWRKLPPAEIERRCVEIQRIIQMTYAQRRITLGRRQMRFESLRDRLLESLENQPNRRGADGPLHRSSRAATFLRLAESAHLKLDTIFLELDGGKEGVFTDIFTKTINAMSLDEADRRAKASEELGKIFQLYTPEERLKIRTERIRAGSIGEITREQAICVLLNCGNDQNLARLMRGLQWGKEELSAALSVLTDKDAEFCQAVWDYLDSFSSEAFDLEERITGVRPTKVQAKPFTLPNGKTLRGGYYPIAYDSRYARSMSESDPLGQSTYQANAFVRSGSMKERGSSGLSAPLKLSLDVLPEHVSDMTHTLAMREPVRELTRLLSDNAVRSAMISRLGPEKFRAVLDGLRRIAGKEAPKTFYSAAASRLRHASALWSMGFRLSTALSQLTGLIYTRQEIGLRWTFIGLSDAINGGRVWEAADAARAESLLMRHRLTNIDREIQEMSTGMIDFGDSSNIFMLRGNQLRKFMQKRAFSLMGLVQFYAADLPTYCGARAQWLEKHPGDEKGAVSWAERVVERTQGGSMKKDLAGVQDGAEMSKLFTMYYGFFSTLFQLFHRRVAAVRNAETRRARLMEGLKLADLFILGMMLESVASAFVKGSAPGEDAGEPEDLLKMYAVDALMTPFQMFVGVRDVANAISRGFSGRGFSLSLPSFAPLESLSSFLIQSADLIPNLDDPKKDGGEVVRKWMGAGLKTFGFGSGLWNAQAQNTLDLFLDWLDDDAEDLTLYRLIGRNNRPPFEILQHFFQ
ncbi:MAG: hypothetical protein PUB69_00435 [Desulfovibrionaceae bacterium]|nr:hypothetical protein [Desulfovibrionaceae bacterium]